MAEASRAPDRSTWWNRYELWRDGQMAETEDELFELQLYDLGQFTEMVRDASFTQITVHAAYQVGRPSTTTGVPRPVARKVGSLPSRCR